MSGADAGREAARRAIHEAMRAGRAQLDLSGLGLTSLPVDLRRFTRLRTLKVEGNRLRALPAWIGELTNLHRLELRNNRLGRCPQNS
jgi:internalin A